jgi:hypothetical protein
VLNCCRERYLLVTVRADIKQTLGAGLVAVTDPVDRQFIRQSVNVRTAGSADMWRCLGEQF